MSLSKKIIQIFIVIFLASFLVSCTEDGCVEADEFDVESVQVKSYPVEDGITGTYDNVDGGQKAEWHQTGLKSNGDQFIIETSGAWTPWNRLSTTDKSLKALPRCNFCAKKEGSINCICYPDQTPQIEIGSNGRPVSTVPTFCNSASNQADPSLCSCASLGTNAAMANDAYHIVLNAVGKDENLKIPDNQSICKFDRGMGLYMGLFGSKGADNPTRAYHLFSTTEICNIIRNSSNQCIDSGGNDRTRYQFKSANEKIFVKDDHNGNATVDTNSSDDEYHTANEDIKLIIYDRYYNDNYGSYNVMFLKGVGTVKDPGLLEFLVRLVEDSLLGSFNEDGERVGGVIEFMYKAIVHDSAFIISLRVALILYVTIYGLFNLLGLAEINKKELMTRMYKIGLIILFTSEDSWYFYNKFIVQFFKDGMDYVVASIMDLSDSFVESTSMVKIAQMDRNNDLSNATRFSYVDVIIKKLLSDAVTKKIFSLFFGEVFFGIIYIVAIYALIGYFIFVMLFVATIYIINVMKLIFILSIGPIFIVFSLFKQTEGMFKNWVAFLGARSLEIVFLFTILYNFLTLIDRSFNDLLSYRACYDSFNIGLFSLKILRSHTGRDLMEWLMALLKIGGLLFITQMVVQKVGDIAGQLISINGSAGGAGSASFNAAGKIMESGMGYLKSAAGGALSAGANVGAVALTLGASAARASGVASGWNKLGKAMPFRSPRTLMRDSVINNAIKTAQAQVKASGKTGVAADAAVRKAVVDSLNTKMFNDPKKMATYGVNTKSIAAQLDKKLVQEPLKDAIKAEAKKLKKGEPGNPSNVKLGKEMHEALRKNVEAWADKNLVGGKDAIQKSLSKSNSVQDLIKSQSELSSSKAAKRFAGDAASQAKYMAHLEKQQMERAQKDKEAAKHWHTNIANKFKKGYHNIKRDNVSNPKLVRENFLRKAGYEEARSGGFVDNRRVVNTSKGFNPLNRINILDKAIHKGKLSKASNEARRNVLLDRIKQEFKPNLKDAAGKDLSAVDKAKAIAQSRAERSYYESELSKIAVKDLRKPVKEILNLERDIKIKEALRLDAGKKKAEVEKLRKELAERVKEEFKPKAEGAASGAVPKDGEDRTMFEKLERWSYIQRELGTDPKVGESSSMDPQIAAARAIEEQVSKTLETAAPASIVTAENLDAVKVAVKETEEGLKSTGTGLVATGMEVQFGASITDVLMKESDIGLKAGNPFLGVKDSEGNSLDPSVVKGLESEKTITSAKLKMNEMKKKYKKFELEKLKDSGTPQEIYALEKEIEDIDRSIQSCEKDIANIQAALSVS